MTTYSYVTLVDPLQGASGWTEASGINNNGQVVGNFSPDGLTTEGFIYSNGSYTTH
jgi:probable HAF family extracellular repeat protein